MKEKISINYLFDPNTIGELKAWMFCFCFAMPESLTNDELQEAMHSLKTIDWQAMRITSDLANPVIEASDASQTIMLFKIPLWKRKTKKKTLTITAEVPEEIRRSEDGLEKYQSDVWRFLAAMYKHGFGEVYYDIDEEGMPK